MSSSARDRILWSFRPILIFCRWIGIDLINEKPHRGCWFKYSLLCFLVNLVAQLDVLNFLRRPELYSHSVGYNISHRQSEFVSVTSSWNILIDFANYSIHSLGSHLIILIIIKSRRWDILMKAFCDCDLLLNVRFYIALRRLSVFGILYILGLVTANCICLFFDHYGHSSFHRVLIGYLVVLGQIYPMSVMVLFCLASYTSASLFTATQEQIIRLNYRVPRSMERLASIKERHALVCEATACLTDCFGWSLLLTTTFLFLTIINSFFYFFGEMNDDRVMMIDVLCGTTGLIHLLILSIAAHYICDQAVEVKRSLLKIQNQHNQELIRPFVFQVSQNVPRISALGCFIAVGTALTYFFILFQLETSEKRKP